MKNKKSLGFLVLVIVVISGLFYFKFWEQSLITVGVQKSNVSLKQLANAQKQSEIIPSETQNLKFKSLGDMKNFADKEDQSQMLAKLAECQRAHMKAPGCEVFKSNKN